MKMFNIAKTASLCSSNNMMMTRNDDYDTIEVHNGGEMADDDDYGSQKGPSFQNRVKMPTLGATE